MNTQRSKKHEVSHLCPAGGRLRFEKRPGFTLIELLTVIAIIGILASILIPVVGKVRESARRASCQSNLRQIGVAAHGYFSDNYDRFPPYESMVAAGGNKNWIYHIFPYVGEIVGEGTDAKGVGGVEIFRCPSHEIPVEVHERTYKWNNFLRSTQPLGYPVTYTGTSDATQTIMVFDRTKGDRIANTPYTLFQAGTSSWHRDWDRNTSATYWDAYPFPHGQEAVNLLFLDGHVETVQWPAPGLTVGHPDHWYYPSP